MWTESLLCTLTCMCGVHRSNVILFTFIFPSTALDFQCAQQKCIRWMVNFAIVHRTHFCRHHSMLWYIHAIRTITTSIRGEWRQKKLLSPQTNMRSTNVCMNVWENGKVCICSATFFPFVVVECMAFHCVPNEIVAFEWTKRKKDQESIEWKRIAIVIWSLIIFIPFFFGLVHFAIFQSLCYCGQNSLYAAPGLSLSLSSYLNCNIKWQRKIAVLVHRLATSLCASIPFLSLHCFIFVLISFVV